MEIKFLKTNGENMNRMMMSCLKAEMRENLKSTSLLQWWLLKISRKKICNLRITSSWLGYSSPES